MIELSKTGETTWEMLVCLRDIWPRGIVTPFNAFGALIDSVRGSDGSTRTVFVRT
jgi:hypothetical protein